MDCFGNSKFPRFNRRRQQRTKRKTITTRMTKIFCQLMFGPFLAPSSTVLADESQERTKTFLTNQQPTAQQQQPTTTTATTTKTTNNNNNSYGRNMFFYIYWTCSVCRLLFFAELVCCTVYCIFEHHLICYHEFKLLCYRFIITEFCVVVCRLYSKVCTI